MRKRILLIALALFALGCMAQGTKNWEEYLNELSDMEDMDNVSWEQYHDILAEYAEQPMNHGKTWNGFPSWAINR